ncbi:hypothetical protein FRC20_011451 [Serendipita sp. 405]|nr:hypothetical protein FRC15_011377 [Serendipita sp. 397]KAG8861576.1 hypothetical protein FRC20_011451 [Serendipita sp. 405]
MEKADATKGYRREDESDEHPMEPDLAEETTRGNAQEHVQGRDISYLHRQSAEENAYYYGSKKDRFGSCSTSHISKVGGFDILTSVSIDYDHLQDLTMSTRPPHHPYYVRVRWDYTAGAYNQMDLVPNEVTEVIWISPNGWWEGRSRDGKR